jgi:hypothetical protein
MIVTEELCASVFRVEVSVMLPGRFTRISKENMEMMNQKEKTGCGVTGPGSGN